MITHWSNVQPGDILTKCTGFSWNEKKGDEALPIEVKVLKVYPRFVLVEALFESGERIRECANKGEFKCGRIFFKKFVETA